MGYSVFWLSAVLPIRDSAFGPFKNPLLTRRNQLSEDLVEECTAPCLACSSIQSGRESQHRLQNSKFFTPWCPTPPGEPHRGCVND